MALDTASDGTITLRQGSGAIFGHLTRRYGVEPTVYDERIGGSVMMLCWRYERDGVRYAAVASAGLERIPFVGVPPVEVVAEVLEHQVGAAVVVVRTVVERAVQELQSPWEPGRVWINDVPLLNDGLVATSKHLSTTQSLMEDESKAWDAGVLEDLKRQRDALVSVRDMFDRRERLDKDNIPYLERRIQNNETKLASLRAKPDGLVKPGEIEKVVEAIIKVRVHDEPKIQSPAKTLATGQRIDRDAAQPGGVRQGVRAGRADLLPADAVPRQPVEPGLGAGARQVLGDAGGQLAPPPRRARGHAPRRLGRVRGGPRPPPQPPPQPLVRPPVVGVGGKDDAAAMGSRRSAYYPARGDVKVEHGLVDLRFHHIIVLSIDGLDGG